MPLSYREVALAPNEVTPDGFMLRGGYPRLYDVDIPSYVFLRTISQPMLNEMCRSMSMRVARGLSAGS